METGSIKKHFIKSLFIVGSFSILIFCTRCSNGSGKSGSKNADELEEKVKNLIRQFTASSSEYFFQQSDSGITLKKPELAKRLYEKAGIEPLWTSGGQWKPSGDSLFAFLQAAQLFGLFPEDYHFKKISEIRDKIKEDSLGVRERVQEEFWAKADILCTDAFTGIIRDTKLGRIRQDSISLQKDTMLTDDYYWIIYQKMDSAGLQNVMSSIEPKQWGYRQLKAGIRKFMESTNKRNFTEVPFPVSDRAGFKKALQQRLFEEGFISFTEPAADSLQLTQAVKRFQEKKGILADGRAGGATVRLMNLNERQQFLHMALSMDKYKLLPESMPDSYIFVNAASNLLYFIKEGRLVLKSRVICGKPNTRTPLLTSQVNQLITYPQWFPPHSIISREILPAVKKNTGYLAKRGFSLVDKNGETVHPDSVDWSKFDNTIPYRVIQGSGDANALGIMKFVFNNEYSVYLHDTNQRYLFGNPNRSLSHGCVRVEEWEQLMNEIIRYQYPGQGTRVQQALDSLKTWLQHKQKNVFHLKNKVPLYIRYITCEGENGSLVFYDDIYSEDKILAKKYFPNK